jgi:hypothetical protein
MAISANTVWEVRATGSDNNGGGFVAGASGTDYSQQDSAQYSFADLASSNATNASPSVTSASHTFVSSDVGNILRITAGTNWTAGAYQIVSVSAGAAVLDKACGSAASVSSGSYVVGGAFASPGLVSAFAVSGNIAYIKNGSYTITSASTGVANGCIGSWTGGLVIGYNTTRTITNTDSSRPTLTLSGVSSATMVSSSARQLILNGNSEAVSRGTVAIAMDCTFQNFTNSASTGIAIRCHATGCATVAVFTGSCYWCTATNNSIASFAPNGGVCANCIAWANTATAFSSTAIVTYINCIAYGNTGATTDGFATGTTNASAWVNCISEGNGRNGFNLNANTSRHHLMINCAHYNNGTNVANSYFEVSTIALSGSPFVDASTQDFRLNNTASAGASLRAAGYPATWAQASASMANYLDIGAAQHQDSGGGLMTHPGMTGGMRG